jgi:hypothetical protein
MALLCNASQSFAALISSLEGLIPSFAIEGLTFITTPI